MGRFGSPGQKKMETGPPKLIEDIVGILIPPACREHVLGDMYEQYVSPAQYIRNALATLPFIVASQVRRSFRLELFFSQMCVLYLAFSGASLAAGPAFLYDHAALLPLGIVIGIALLVLVLCDAYAVPQDHSSRKLGLEVGMALSVVWCAQRVFAVFKPEWMLPNWLMLAGTSAGLPALFMLRRFFKKVPQGPPIREGSSTPLDEIRRVSGEEYKKAWRVNWIWLVAALAVVITTPQVRTQSPLWNLGSAVLLVVVLCITALRSKKGEIGAEQRYRSLSISRDPYRNELERKRDGLLFWAGGGLLSLLPGAGPTLILCLIGFPLLMFLVRRLTDISLPSTVSAARIWIAFVAFVILCVAWVFVRAANLRAARAINQELDSLDSTKKDQ